MSRISATAIPVSPRRIGRIRPASFNHPVAKRNGLGISAERTGTVAAAPADHGAPLLGAAAGGKRAPGGIPGSVVRSPTDLAPTGLRHRPRPLSDMIVGAVHKRRRRGAHGRFPSSRPPNRCGGPETVPPIRPARGPKSKPQLVVVRR
ncbi:hypothetical protein Val02_40200 [Virgisporangium aliadipatigenens]|uniref:Uncharacterized protein n=1 Tax=Virgisporangium aliadipatigenens TaxID=741659 RepID=A0A8J3YKP7_9ACTN|nr:hypothetical protein Val02_40200 [Virgisporangium aliadipatigenens]